MLKLSIDNGKLMRGLTFVSALFLLSCGGAKRESDYEKIKAQFCKPSTSTHRYEEFPYRGGSANVLSFQSIRARVNTACASCHQAPAKNGGFSYFDDFAGQSMTVNGSTQYYPGLSEVAEKMRDAINSTDPKKRMPPTWEKAPDTYAEISRQLSSWILAGKINGTFQDGKPLEIVKGKVRPVRPVATTDLGDCVPTAKAVGNDLTMDRKFETATQLPKYLSETDLVSLDGYVLAQKGTFAYNVEYPLWADNAEKGRYIHVPMKLEDGEVKQQTIKYNQETQQFEIPDNTRFYKTFYRAIKMPNKKIRMKRVETRIIVTRTPWDKSLFGTYQWDETEQVAVLVDAPYRDGTPWRDTLFDITVDEITGKIRPYGIPGRQRCVDCHKGSQMNNFVLGFMPLQINRRPIFEGGRIDSTSTSELSQVERFEEYGILEGMPKPQDRPKLETSGAGKPRNIYELRANGYFVGNCYHCHNKGGFAHENGIELKLGPGDIFEFDTARKSVEVGLPLVHHTGDILSSQIWHKIQDPPSQQGIYNQMPMHTAGSPDCRALYVVGQWIASFQSLEAAEQFDPGCKKENPIYWVDMDFTWPESDKYTPRRNDWADPAGGMPELYRKLEMTPELKEALRTEYAVNYWIKKPECEFPKVDIPPEKRRPWMMTGSRPKKPFGEVYYTTPGSYFFRDSCMKCHGPQANGKSSLATAILNWSGGKVRVANLFDGMFGNKGENIKTFQVGDRNLAGNYMIWMAMEGTRVQFPPGLDDIIGKHGGRMLNSLRDGCLRIISPLKGSTPSSYQYEIFDKVCFFNNLQRGHPDIAFDSEGQPVNPEKLEQWLDRAAYNIGWAVFDFLLEAATTGEWRPTRDQCEKVYPKKKQEGT